MHLSFPPVSLVAATALFALTLPAVAQTDPSSMKDQHLSSSAPLQLDRFRDRQRVIVAYLPGTAREQTQMFHQRWANSAGELKERDAVLVEIDDLHKQPADTLRRLGFKEGKFGLALVGKDGNVAWQSSEPVAPREIFDRIDAMPMRQREMRDRQQKKG